MRRKVTLATAKTQIAVADVLSGDHDAKSEAYARKVWNGQSPDLPRKERLARVVSALEAQGLSMIDLDKLQ